MKSRPHILVFAAAGVALLSACGGTDRTAGTGKPTDTAPARVAAVQDLAGGGTTFPAPGDVVCGPVDPEAGNDDVVMAMATTDGTVGCTEAFDVLAEYAGHPFDQDDGTMRAATLASGWTCAVAPHPELTSEKMVFCTNGTRSGHGLAFYTLPPGAAPAGELTLPVADHLDNPGDVECGSMPEMAGGPVVMAMATPWGTASCDEASSVMLEVYDRAVDGGMGNGPVRLASGWVCDAIEHADFPGERIVYCDSGYVEEVGEFVDGLAVYSMPVAK